MSLLKRQNHSYLDLTKIVDKDVQSLLLPLNVFQYITLCPKYRIINNYIKQNSFISNVISFVGTLVFIVFIGSRVYDLERSADFHKLSLFARLAIYYDWIFYSIGFIINFVISVSQSRNAITLVLSFQNVHRFLNNETITKRFIIWNWIIVIVFNCGHVVFFTCTNLYLKLPYYYICYSFTVISFDINIFYALRILRLLKYKIVLWEDKALKVEVTTEDNYSKQMFQAYINILECYDMHKKCFQHFILYYGIEIFTHALMYIQTNIELFSGTFTSFITSAPILTTLVILTWLIKDLTWLTLLCHQCEKFYAAVQSIQDTCTLILKTNCSDTDKRLYKNVQRLHRPSFSKIRACGLFYMDAASQLTLISYLANYFIVLIQFAIL